MRVPLRAASVLTVAVAAAASLTNSATTTPHSAAASTRTIVYAGARIAVPAGWPVYDLAKDPTRCVRFDQHAVYLGHPGTDQQCPAHLVGRTTALLIEPNDASAETASSDADSGTKQAVSANGRALITASYGGAGANSATAALAGTSVKAATAKTAPSVAAKPGAISAAPVPAVLGQSYGFDTCTAPSKATMNAWRSSSFRNVAVYIGGINRACGDGNLNSSWVSTIHHYGYHIIPTYVGRQAACSGVGAAISSNPTLATENGRNAAHDAIHDMERLGLKGVVYLDIEQYNGSATCVRSVLRFITEWVHRLHLSGYRAGVYTSNFHDLVARHNTAGFNDPDGIWIGRWNGKASVYGDPVIPDRFWNPHKRLHQYLGPHNQTHGGATLNIDSDYLDGPVA